ncbi:MAG TPA: hypothetical protein VIM11_18395 [Tepidisphaeraceae bacterium]
MTRQTASRTIQSRSSAADAALLKSPSASQGGSAIESGAVEVRGTRRWRGKVGS